MLYPSDRKYDPNQQIKDPKGRDPIGADIIRRLKWLIMNHVQAGPGITVSRSGGRTFISLKRGAVGTGGGLGTSSGSYVHAYEAETKGGLDDMGVPRASMGFVTEGSQKGMVCVRNEDGDGWDALNVCE